ncbi:hypothetical protein RJ641_024859 [Dillenia turbinata]|uniref:J domain-containing protein n=1 Tax=Dillenia turbinata TaxID=194707 RepID=A0AAN8ZNC7_9MAGN
MTRREAALVHGIRKGTKIEQIKEAHRKVMMTNHPDPGCSHYPPYKISEAKDVMLGKIKNGGSAF